MRSYRASARAAVAFAMVGLSLASPALTAERGASPTDTPPDWPHPVEDSQTFSLVLLDQLEYRLQDSVNATRIDSLAWIGGDYQRFWLELEGQIDSGDSGGEIERMDVLYGRLIAPFWDLQLGVSYQSTWGPGPDPDRISAVIGLQGLSRYRFEIDTNLRLSEDGDLSADFQATYDLRLTQRWVLQPRFETLLAAQEVREFDTGQGLNSVRLGARLRFEVRREFAPYAGLTWFRSLGETADLARADGQPVDDLAVAVGARLWF